MKYDLLLYAGYSLIIFFVELLLPMVILHKYIPGSYYNELRSTASKIISVVVASRNSELSSFIITTTLMP